MNLDGPDIAVLCAEAVDELEIVAALEAAGFTDDHARERGHGDVFTLARTMLGESVRRPAAVPPPPAPWRPEPLRHLLRGALFGLPGVCYATAAPVLGRAPAGYLLVLSLLLAWPAAQVVAYLGYVRTDGARAAALRTGGVVAAGCIVPPVIAAGLLLHAGFGAIALAAGQCGYLLAATVVLVCAAEVRLLAALAPGVLAGVACLLFAHGSVPWWGAGAWGVSLAAVFVLAFTLTRFRTSSGVYWAELRAAVPQAGFGLAAGALLTFEPVCALLGRPAIADVRAAGTATTVAVLALSLSMGAAEWLVVGYRARAAGRLRRARELRGPRGFGWRARLGLLGAVGRYVFVLAALIAGISWAAVFSGGHRVFEAAPVLAGHLLLGTAFFVALILQSCGQSVVAAWGAAAALAAEAVLVATGVASPAVVRCLVAGTLLAGLLGHGLVVLSRATAHR